MMTTIRRQTASCIFGLAPLLREILSGKIDQIEALEFGDTEENFDLSFVDGIRLEIEELLAAAEHMDKYDPKLEAFLNTLREKGRMSNNKALVFSTFRHTLAYLSDYLESEGVRFGLVHGQIPDDERAHLRRRFGLPKQDSDALDVLLSSEVGCEGLDFQFCDMIINYDLPWNPMRVEQRIGRIDRYGQKSETVAIVNMITPGTVDAEIYARCLWRIGVFQHAIGGCEEILGTITREIHAVSESFTLSVEEREQRLQQLSDNGIRRMQEDEALEAQQAELFGLNLKSQHWEEDLASSDSFWLSPTALARCVSRYLARRLDSPGEYLLGDKPVKSLRLSQQARLALLADYRVLPKTNDPTAREWEKWLRGTQPMLSVTFDQATAAEAPKIVHLTVLHPLVRQAAANLAEPACFNIAVHLDYSFAVFLPDIVES